MKRVLLADDSLFMRSIIKEILNKNGLEVVAEAENGLEAVIKYKESNPDCTFLDINMNEMNGIEALKEIIAYNPEAVIIMCSTMGQQSFVIECIQLGAKDFIVKPFNESTIKNTLEYLFQM